MSETQIEKRIPFFGILAKNILIILAVTILCGAIGYAYSVKRVKPSYTATKSVIIRLMVDLDTSSSHNSEASNSATLSKMYVSSIAEIINSQAVTEEATNILPRFGLDSGKVTGDAINCEYTDGSLIFNISYTDETPELAQKKLNAVIESASSQLIDYVEAREISLIPVQNGEGMVEKGNEVTKFTIIAFAVGLVLGICLALLKFFLDNTISDRDELEAITGVPLLTFIEEVKYDKN